MLNERLKEVRKYFKLSQEEFGHRLGVGKTAISKLEKGENKFTEQMIKLVCSEYHVDYMWFTIGEGDMISSSDDDTLELIDRIMTGEPTFRKNIIKSLASADEEDLAALERIIDLYIKNKADV